MIDRRAAFRAQRADVLAFCESLAPADWRMNSRASGWSIADVVAHMGSACHAMFTRQAAKLMRGDDIEAVNDELVAARRDRTPTEVFTEYLRWSRVFGAVVPTMVQTPLGRLEMPLAELGRFPAYCPAHWCSTTTPICATTWLRALGRSVGDIDANRMAAVLEVDDGGPANQLTAAAPAWLDRPLALTLTPAPAAVSWRVDTAGAVTRTHRTGGGASPPSPPSSRNGAPHGRIGAGGTSRSPATKTTARCSSMPSTSSEVGSDSSSSRRS